MYLLDTNVISELRKARTDKCHPAVTSWFEKSKTSELYLSTIVVFELKKGILLLQRKDRLQAEHINRWFESHVLANFQGRILPVSTDIAMASAELHIPNPRPERDAFIGATALVHDMTLVTRNTKDFENTGVKLINPWLT